MTSIDLIVLGILKKESLSAYEIQKIVDYRDISKWVKVSTPTIYKKVIQLEKKGLVSSKIVKEGKMPEKAVYSLTELGEREFEELMFKIAEKPIRFFLDFNSVIVNLPNLSYENQKLCLSKIESEIDLLKENINEKKELKEKELDKSNIGMAVLNQQSLLAESIEKWLESVKEIVNMNQT